MSAAIRCGLGPDADSAVVREILANRDVFTWTEFAGGMTSTVPDTTERVTVPVMLVNGSMDRLCEPGHVIHRTLRAVETPYFSPSARLRVYVLPRSGHAVDLAPGTVEYQRRVIEWADGL